MMDTVRTGTAASRVATASAAAGLAAAAIVGGWAYTGGGVGSPGVAVSGPAVPARADGGGSGSTCSTRWSATLDGPAVGHIRLGGSDAELEAVGGTQVSSIHLYANEVSSFDLKMIVGPNRPFRVRSFRIPARAAELDLSELDRLGPKGTGRIEFGGEHDRYQISLAFMDRPYRYVLGFSRQVEDGASKVASFENAAEPIPGGDRDNGYVEITRHTDSHVSGKFSAKVVTYEQEASSVVDENYHLAPEMAPYRSTLQGTFDIYANGSGPCPFEIATKTPDAGDRNIDYRKPGVRITFTEPFVPAMVNDRTVQVGYMDPAGHFRPAAGRLRPLPGDRAVEFLPEGDLKDATFYHVRVVGGAAGVRSAGRDTLDTSTEWRFATAVNLNEPGNQTLTHVFQTSRDAQLVRGKPAAIRVYANWRPDPDVAAGEQVETFVARVTGLGAGNRSLAEPSTVRFVRPDLFDKYHVRRRFAEHTANLFGWRPRRTDGAAVRGRIQVTSDATGETLLFESNRAVSYWGPRPTLDFDYYFLEVGDWSGGVPKEARASGRLAARRAELYATQNLPVLATHGHDGGPLAIGTGARLEAAGWELGAAAADWLKVDPTRKLERATRASDVRSFMKLFEEAVGPYTGSMILVGFVPPSLHPGGTTYFDAYPGLTSWSATTAAPPAFWKRTVAMPLYNFVYTTDALTHEFGHSFGLHHRPDVPDADARTLECASGRSRMAGIEGFRMARSGRFGANKSFEEGNAESGTLLPLMYPCAKRQIDAFVMDRQYDRLLENVSSWLALAGPRSGEGVGIHTGPMGRFAATRGVAGGERTWRASPYPRHPVVQWASLREIPQLGADRAPLPLRFGGTAVPRLRTRPSAPAPPTESTLQLSGLVGADGRIHLAGVALFPASRVRTGSTGPYTAETRDTRDSMLASVSFGPSPGQPPDGPRAFRVALPWNGAAARLVVRRGDQVLAERWRSAHPPTVRILDPPPGARWSKPRDLRWTGLDEDGDSLVYTVLYSPNGTYPWHPLAFAYTSTRLHLDPANLEAGPHPTLRVLVSDGFDQAEARVSLSLARPLVLEGVTPEAEDTVDRMLDVGAFFADEVDSTSLHDGGFVLLDASRRPVHATVSWDGPSRTALLTPLAPLAPGEYTAVLKADVAGRFANRLSRERRWSFRVRAGGGTGGLPVTTSKGPEGSRLAEAHHASPSGLSGASGTGTESSGTGSAAASSGAGSQSTGAGGRLGSATAPGSRLDSALARMLGGGSGSPRVDKLSLRATGSLETSESLTSGATASLMAPCTPAGIPVLILGLEAPDGVTGQVSLQPARPVRPDASQGVVPVDLVYTVRRGSSANVFMGKGELTLYPDRDGKKNGGVRGTVRATGLHGVHGGTLDLRVTFAADLGCVGGGTD